MTPTLGIAASRVVFSQHPGRCYAVLVVVVVAPWVVVLGWWLFRRREVTA